MEMMLGLVLKQISLLNWMDWLLATPILESNLYPNLAFDHLTEEIDWLVSMPKLNSAPGGQCELLRSARFG